MLGQPIQKMFTEFQKVILLELFHFICTFDFIAETAALNREGIDQVEVAVDAQARTIPLILLIAKLTVLILEVGGHIV